MKRSSYHFAVTLVAGSALLTGCLDKTGKLRGPGAGNQGSNSVVAAIGGISDEDLARSGMKYWLACDGGVRVEGTRKADNSAVEFPGDKIKNDMTCAMEVKISEEEGAKLDWDWFGVANGNPVVGLMYGSSKGKVAKRALELELYRLYSPKSAQSFSAELAVTLELAEGAEMPADDKTSASLVCSETESFPGTYKKEADKNALLVFANLKIKDLKDRSCSKVVLLVDNKEAFSGETKDLKFVDPKKGEPQKFPKEAGTRYVLKAADVGGAIDVGTIPGGICLNYENSECKDRRTASLGKWPKNYMIAKVMGISDDGNGDTVTFYVGAGATGFGLLNGDSLDVKAVNKAARSAAGSDERKAFSFYKAAVADDLFETTFDGDFVSGKAFESYLASEEDLDKVMLVHIDELRVHGMHVIQEDDLNKAEKAHWMAVVKAKKDNDEKAFIATGIEKYFYSPAAPATKNDKPAFLNLETLVADMAKAAPEKYRAYAMKDGIMATESCKLEESAYIAGISARHLGELKADAPNTELDACEISGDKFSAAVGTGYTFSAELYSFGWFEVK